MAVWVCHNLRCHGRQKYRATVLKESAVTKSFNKYLSFVELSVFYVTASCILCDKVTEMSEFVLFIHFYFLKKKK